MLPTELQWSTRAATDKYGLVWEYRMQQLCFEVSLSMLASFQYLIKGTQSHSYLICMIKCFSGEIIFFTAKGQRSIVCFNFLIRRLGKWGETNYFHIIIWTWILMMHVLIASSRWPEPLPLLLTVISIVLQKYKQVKWCYISQILYTFRQYMDFILRTTKTRLHKIGDSKSVSPRCVSMRALVLLK